MSWFARTSSLVLFFCLCASAVRGDEPAPRKPMDVPVAIGHNAMGLRIPIHSPEGKTQVIFDTDIVFRKDQQTLRLTDLRIETFDDEGKPEMIIAAPLSHFDLNTQMLTSDKPVTIKRPEVEVTGDRLIFDARLRQGKLVGQVKVRLFRAKEVKP